MNIGDKVEKIGDYHALGEIRAVFTMTTGVLRFVVEHQAEGGGSFCHIYSAKNIRLVSNKTGMSDDPRCSFTDDGTCRVD